MGKFSLGIDIGTTSAKVVLYDPTEKCIKKEASAETQATVLLSDPLKNEQNVKAIFTALDCILGQFDQADLQQVAYVGISGQMHGVLLWGENAWTWNNGAIKLESVQINNLVTWQDSRCSPEFLASLPTPESHLKAHTGFGVPTLFWLKRDEPSLEEKFSYAGTIHDFLVAALTGNKGRPIMSPQNAASWGYFNTATRSWNTDILAKADFPVNLLPDVKEGFAGVLCKNWKGVPAGCKVGIALGDLQASVYSILSSKPDEAAAVINISTSAQLTVLMPNGFEPAQADIAKPEGVEYFPYFEGQYLAVAAALTGGNALAKFISMFSEWLREFGCQYEKDQIWSTFLSAGSQQISTDLEICPTLFGERTDPEKRGTVSNITGGNLSLGHISRSLCRGIITNLEELMPLKFITKQGVQKIYGSGSALLRNQVLQEEISSVFQCIPLELTSGADSAFGAAIYAATKLG